MGDQTVKIGDQEIIIREMTVAEVDQWIERKGEGELKGSATSAILFDDPFLLEDLASVSSLGVEELARLTPPVVEQIRQAAEKANPPFFAVRRKLREVMEEALQSSIENSAESSAVLSAPATPTP
ncbi:MAG: hypothetical protein HQL52_17455 [Magnetococcales bacterium]|nr:hypothetical protein [Magnetococcales bacterium]